MEQANVAGTSGEDANQKRRKNVGKKESAAADGLLRRIWRSLTGSNEAAAPPDTPCRHHLHLGAHKTGTTYCQTLLKINRDKLACNGIAYWDLHRTRRELTPYLLGLSKRKGLLSREECAARLAGVLQSKEAASAARLVISDENLMGFIKDILRRRGYRGLRRRMAPIRDALGQDVKVFLTVRSYAEFISSMYCELVTTKPYFPFEEVRAGSFAAEFSWLSVYKDLVKVFGRRNVVVFDYHTFFKNPTAHLSHLVGAEMEFEYPKKQIRTSPSARAIEFIGSEGAANPDVPLKEIVARANQLFPRSAENPAFDPWTPEERAALDERYRRDLERIPCWEPRD